MVRQDSAEVGPFFGLVRFMYPKTNPSRMHDGTLV